MHRVEHSLHVRLYDILSGVGGFGQSCTFDHGRHQTMMIHKEWPETVPRPKKKGRGNFDLAILAPNQLSEATLPQFVGGHIEAAIVIEVGLNYGYSHLENDYKKLVSSGVRAGYLVDLRRIGRPDSRSHHLVENLKTPIRAAYAHHQRGGTSIFKHVEGWLQFT